MSYEAVITMELDGLQDMLKKYSKLGPALVEIVSQRLYRGAEGVMTRSKRDFVPVVSGTLRASGRVERPKVVQGLICEQVIGFGGAAAKYAYRVHENPRSGKTKGKAPDGRRYKRYSRVGQWKYLETPAVQATPGMVQDVGKGLEAAWKKAGF